MTGLHFDKNESNSIARMESNKVDTPSAAVGISCRSTIRPRKFTSNSSDQMVFGQGLSYSPFIEGVRGSKDTFQAFVLEVGLRQISKCFTCFLDACIVSQNRLHTRRNVSDIRLFEEASGRGYCTRVDVIRQGAEHCSTFPEVSIAVGHSPLEPLYLPLPTARLIGTLKSSICAVVASWKGPVQTILRAFQACTVAGS